MFEFPLDGSYNARAIGAKHAPWLVRAAALDELTADGERALRDRGVDLVIDLREPSERSKRRHSLTVQSLPLYGKRPPTSGTIESVYTGLVRDRGPQLAAAVIAIAEHPGTAVVHCTAGKDRTGLVVALARLAAGEPRCDVLDDYARSGSTVRPARRELVAQQLDALDLAATARADAERLHLDSPAEALLVALDFVDQLGGAHSYLLRHGARTEHFSALARRVPTAEPTSPVAAPASPAADPEPVR